MILAALSCLLPLTCAQVQLRGPGTTPPHRVQTIAAEGVSVTWENGTGETLAWDRVRSVSAEDAADAAPYLELAQTAWRARTRLERGDAIGAEPLFESLYPSVRDSKGPTAITITEGLLRCRLRRGATASATDAWLAWLRAGGGTSTSPNTSPITSPGTGTGDLSAQAFPLLMPLHEPPLLVIKRLPPIFLPGPELRALANEPADPGAAQSQPPSGDTIERLASLYRAAARFELDRTPGGGGTVPASSSSEARVPDAQAWPAVSNDPTYTLVREIVLSRIGDQPTRAASRAALDARLKRTETSEWIRAWCRTAIGRSLILETDAESKRRGTLELLTAYVAYAEEDPNLAAIALSEAAQTLTALGDQAGADRLWLLAGEHFPGHPALDELAVRRAQLRSPKPSTSQDTPSAAPSSSTAPNGG